MEEFTAFAKESPFQPSGTSILNALEGASNSQDLVTITQSRKPFKGEVLLLL